MNTHDIKKALELLIQYENTNLSHSFGPYNLSYVKFNGGFRIENTSTGVVDTFTDIESCTTAVSKIMR